VRRASVSGGCVTGQPQTTPLLVQARSPARGAPEEIVDNRPPWPPRSTTSSLRKTPSTATTCQSFDCSFVCHFRGDDVLIESSRRHLSELGYMSIFRANGLILLSKPCLINNGKFIELWFGLEKSTSPAYTATAGTTTKPLGGLTREPAEIKNPITLRRARRSSRPRSARPGHVLTCVRRRAPLGLLAGSEVGRARAVADVARVLVDSAKVEVSFLNTTGAIRSTGFLPSDEEEKTGPRALATGRRP
jgi:hypothetical protein